MGSAPEPRPRQAKLWSILRAAEVAVAAVAMVALGVAATSAPPPCSAGLVTASTAYLVAAWIAAGSLALWPVLAAICRRSALAKLACFVGGSALFVVVGFFLVLASSPCSLE